MLLYSPPLVATTYNFSLLELLMIAELFYRKPSRVNPLISTNERPHIPQCWTGFSMYVRTMTPKLMRPQPMLAETLRSAKERDRR